MFSASAAAAAAATPRRHLSLSSEVRSVEETQQTSDRQSVSIYPEEALILPYYHPTLATMKEVRDLFSRNLSTNGFFLLRKSFSQFSTLAVSVAFNQVIKHFNISRKDNGAYYLQDRQFQSLHTLVDYYKNQEVPNKEGLPGLHLRYPILDGKRHRFYNNAAKSDRRKHQDTRKPRSVTEPATERKFSSKDYLDTGDVTCRSSKRHPPPPPGRRRHVNVPSDDDIHKNGKSREKETGGGGRHHDCQWNRPPIGGQSASLKVGASDPPRQVRRTESETDGRGYEKLLMHGTAANRGRRRAGATADDSGARPTQPPPPPPKDKAASASKYSYARSPYKAMALELIDSLRRIEGENANKCSCGVYHDDADLPRGWTFHRSTDPETHGRPVFSGPDGQLSWNLPIEVALELSAEQQDAIRELIGGGCRPPHPIDADSIDCDDGLFEGSGSGEKVAHDRDTRRSRQASSATEINAYLEIISDE